VLISFEIKQGYIKGTQGLSQFRQRVVYRPPLSSDITHITLFHLFSTPVTKAKLLLYYFIGRRRPIISGLTHYNFFPIVYFKKQRYRHASVGRHLPKLNLCDKRDRLLWFSKPVYKATFTKFYSNRSKFERCPDRRDMTATSIYVNYQRKIFNASPLYCLM